MIIKEWKEKSGLFLFALAGFVLFSLAASGYSKDKETLDILASTILLVFLPVFSLLLGASGFASELQDGAWAYLFSRPVKKWRIWVTKYLSLLTVLFVVIFLFALLTRIHPALKSAADTFSFPLVGDMSYGILAYALPLLLFTTAFSLSILSEKTHVVAFLAALVWIVMQMAVTRAGFLLYDRGMPSSVFFLISLMSILVPLSLALASLLTLSRADFSQPMRRAWTFTKSAAVFILVSLGLTVLFAFATRMLQSERYIYNLEVRDNAFYFATDRGFFMFDLADGRAEKVAQYPLMWGRMSLGGDKVAFVTYYRGGKRHGFAELRIMKINGTEEKSLVGTWDEESPLYGGFIYPVRVSPQGDRVAFIVRYTRKKPIENLWVINSDGSGLRGYELDIPEAEFYLNIGFENSGQSLFLLCTAKIRPGGKGRPSGAMLLRMNLETGRVETLADQIRKPYVASMARAGLTSEAGLLAYIHYDEAMSREILTVLDPKTLEKQPVYPEDSVTYFRWNKAGDKLAFLTAESVLGVYSPAERKIIQIKKLTGYDLRWPSQALEWTSDDRFILRKLEQEVPSICLLDANLTEQKAIRLPFTTYYAAQFWSAGKYAIVENTEKHQLWGVDLTTEKWTRIY
jgi:ABC-type transport system involved in multi-copper enzyme maturation permease subunit